MLRTGLRWERASATEIFSQYYLTIQIEFLSICLSNFSDNLADKIPWIANTKIQLQDNLLGCETWIVELKLYNSNPRLLFSISNIDNKYINLSK